MTQLSHFRTFRPDIQMLFQNNVRASLLERSCLSVGIAKPSLRHLLLTRNSSVSAHCNKSESIIASKVVPEELIDAAAGHVQYVEVKRGIVYPIFPEATQSDMSVEFFKESSQPPSFPVEMRGNRTNPSLKESVRQTLFALYVPDGYPSSVSSDYLAYQMWVLPAHVLGSLSHSLTTSSLLSAVGLSVGPAGTAGVAAGVKWIIKDGIGALGRLLVGSRLRGEADEDPCFWRMAAEALSSAGLAMEVATAANPAWFVPLAASGSFTRAIAKGLGHPAHRVLLGHFARAANVGAVCAKEEVWEVTAQLTGYLASIALLSLLANITYASQDGHDSALVLLLCWTAVQSGHVFLRYMSLKALRFSSLSRKRAIVLAQAHIASLSGFVSTNNGISNGAPKGHMLAADTSGYMDVTADGSNGWLATNSRSSNVDSRSSTSQKESGVAIGHANAESLEADRPTSSQVDEPMSQNGVSSTVSPSNNGIHKLSHEAWSGDPSTHGGAGNRTGKEVSRTVSSRGRGTVPTSIGQKSELGMFQARGLSSDTADYSQSASARIATLPSVEEVNAAEPLLLPAWLMNPRIHLGCSLKEAFGTSASPTPSSLQSLLDLYAGEPHVLLWRDNAAWVLLRENVQPHQLLRAVWQAAWLDSQLNGVTHNGQPSNTGGSNTWLEVSARLNGNGCSSADRALAAGTWEAASLAAMQMHFEGFVGSLRDSGWDASQVIISLGDWRLRVTS